MPTDHDELTSVLSSRRRPRRDDLASAVRALDAEPATMVLPRLREPAPGPHTLVLAPMPERRRRVLLIVAGAAALILVALLIAVVLVTSGAPTQISPPLAPVSPTSPRSAVSAPTPLQTAPVPATVAPPAAALTPPPTAVVSAQMMAPEQPRRPIRDRLHQMFPNLFP